ncbi:MAG: hypothetical protein M9894_23955 [Planctomycetes bacterium]|nr:hypothetical protein [Planctomycetota bacterium]
MSAPEAVAWSPEAHEEPAVVVHEGHEVHAPVLALEHEGEEVGLPERLLPACPKRHDAARAGGRGDDLVASSARTLPIAPWLA